MIYDPQLRFESVAPPRRRRRHLLLSGLTAAAFLGAGTGLLSRPAISEQAHPPPGASPIPSAGMQIVPGPPSIPAGPPLEVLKPFAAKPSAEPPAIGAAATPATTGATTGATAIPATASLRAESQPTFDCASAIGAAETLVCADPRLAAADRRMARAWRRAVQLGAPTWRLRRDQRDWMIAREAAARDAPDEVADLYDQRIRELEALSPPSP